MIQLPRLFVGGKFSKLINPISVSITENIVPLSTATITLRRGEELPARSYVELFNPYGSVGMFRVRSPHNSYGENSSTAELEHMIAELGDYLVKDEISDMMAGTTAVKKIFDHYKGGKWKLGKYSDVGTGRVAVEAKYDSVLNALLSIMEQRPELMMKFDFSTSPWTLSIVKRGTSVVSEGRISRNVASATVTYDDSELCTRAWYQTFKTVKDKDGNATVEAKWTSKDADTKGTYGIVEGKVSTSSDMTTEEINYAVNTFLTAHKRPKTSVSIQGRDLFRITGERIDKLIIGDLYRLALPDYNLTVELNITSISWSNVYGKNLSVMVRLGEEEDTVVTFLHNLDATGSGTRGGGGGGGGKKKQEEEWKEYRTRIEQDDRRIELTAERLRKNNSILEQAGMKLNSKGVLIYTTDTDKCVASRIQTQANRIDLVVRGTGKNAQIDGASIALGINADADKGSFIKLRAKTVDLGNYATVGRLDALEGFFSGKSTATSFVCLNLAVRSGTWVYGANVVSKKTATIAGTKIQYLAWS